MVETTTAFFVFSHHYILIPKEIYNKGEKLAKALSMEIRETYMTDSGKFLITPYLINGY